MRSLWDQLVCVYVKCQQKPNHRLDEENKNAPYQYLFSWYQHCDVQNSAPQNKIHFKMTLFQQFGKSGNLHTFRIWVMVGAIREGVMWACIVFEVTFNGLRILIVVLSFARLYKCVVFTSLEEWWNITVSSHLQRRWNVGNIRHRYRFKRYLLSHNSSFQCAIRHC